MIKCVKIKLYPTPKQEKNLYGYLSCLRRAYNRSLEIAFWHKSRYNWHVTKDMFCSSENSVWTKLSPNVTEEKKKSFVSKKRFNIKLVLENGRHHKNGLEKINTDIFSFTVQDRIEKAFDKWASERSKCANGEIITSKELDKGKPKFANASKFNSFTMRRFYVVYEGKHRYVSIPSASGHKGIGRIKMSYNPKIPDHEDIKNKDNSLFFNKECTVIKEPDGWYISIIYEPKINPVYAKTGESIGIDMNIGSIELSDGRSIELPPFLDAYRHEIVKCQRKMSRSRIVNKGKPFSKRYRKIVCKLAMMQGKVHRMRKSHYAAIAAHLVSTNDVICFENIKPAQMVKNKYLARAISESSWGMFRLIVKTKCASNGRTYIEVNAANTSQTCSSCGWLNKGKNKLGLSVREWDCPSCGIHHDRDINAAKNVLSRGLDALKDSLSGNKLKGANVIRNNYPLNAVIIPNRPELPFTPEIERQPISSKTKWHKRRAAQRAKLRNKQNKKKTGTVIAV